MTNLFDDLFSMFEDSTTEKKETTPSKETKYEIMDIPDTEDSLLFRMKMLSSLNNNAPTVDAPSTFEELSANVDAQVQKAEADEKKKKENQATKKSPAKTKEEEFDINNDTIIRYFREIIPITNYFTLDEITNGIKIKKKDQTFEFKKIDGEMVRKRMEKDFPELVKDYTEMKYIGKDKNFVIPVTIAKKKGCTGEVKKEVESSKDEPASFKFPSKIPLKLLLEFINLARVYAEHKLEIRGEFYYNFDTNSFLLHIPKQTASYHSVTSDDETGYFEIMQLEKNGHYVQLACEIHSHHVLEAIPSKIDNESERKPGMFYIIVGNFQTNFMPDIHIRTFVSIDNKEWHEKCKLPDLFYNDKSSLSFCGLPTDYQVESITITDF
ncbi:hypothetical protein PVA17_22675 [Lysinibacillus sp. CNPSo 3705]|uniref:Mov34/MPN/PAD-1 family protein n=1 Tax=Lysinibacillus sp. CNPSo 3705 TaxID=3028148 RepID=UPI002363E631|nr:Mov34/MPN/PAD-1 family protein [Lysinibacillus sp. CNPSo 3705]MDD1505528.1 hypothetical protein [Lysinibacillus sp. CNPSo 3705]